MRATAQPWDKRACAGGDDVRAADCQCQSRTVSGDRMSNQDTFERMFRDFIAGRLSRRELMAKAGVASAATAVAVSGIAGPARLTRSALAQDATPKPGGGLKM